MKNPIVLIAGLIGVMIVAGAGWYLASPLFIDDVVDEEFPLTAPGAEEPAQMPEAEQEKIEAEALEAAAQMPDKQMDEAMPGTSDSPTIVGQGQFVDADSFHQGSGQATIYRLPDGSHVLRFENFQVTNGPDLRVLLVRHPAPTGRDEIMQDYIDLGPLKGNIGNQNYEIPANVDVSEYQSVVIYCQPFHVIFSTASLG